MAGDVAKSYTGSEYAGKSAEQKKALASYRDARLIAGDFNKSYFTKYVRFYRLFNGQLPPELDGTYSKIMLNLASSMIESELPRSTRALLATTDWFTVGSNTPEGETFAPQVQKWLRYQMEVKQRIASTIIPTLQQTHLFGTGYRIYGHKIKNISRKTRIASSDVMGMPTTFDDKTIEIKEPLIFGQYAGIFDVWPLPGGSIVNQFDDTSSACCDGLIWFDYMSDTDLDMEVKRGNFDKGQVEAMRSRKASGEDVTDTWKAQVVSASGMSHTLPSWVAQIRDKNYDLPHRWAVAWYFARDKWTVVGEDEYVLYHGNPIYSMIPISVSRSSLNLNDFHGRGIIEPTEDLILSAMLLLNQRFDFLSSVMHPTTWVPESLMEHMGDKSRFDQEPFAINEYPDSINSIQDKIFHDSPPELARQAFVEDATLDMLIQKVSGQPNYDKLFAMPANPGVSNTASGFMGLLAEGSVRSLMRAVTIEETGLLDCLYLTLKLGAQIMSEPQAVRTGASGDGWPWEKFDPRLLEEDFNIMVGGSRSLTMADQNFRKMVELTNIVASLLSNPRTPPALLQQLMAKSNVIENVDEIMAQLSQNSAPPTPQGGLPIGEGGVPQGPQTEMGNQMQAVANRNQVMAGNPIA